MALTVNLSNRNDPNYTTVNSDGSQVISNNNYTYLNITGSLAGATYVEWQFRKVNKIYKADGTIDLQAASSSSDITFRTDNNGLAGGYADSVLPIVNFANLDEVGILLDRSKNWQVRVKPSNASYSDWQDLELSGELRLMGAQHRDSFSTENSATGKIVSILNPLFSLAKSARGLIVTKNKRATRGTRNI